MANRSLGTLSIDVVANTASFIDGLSKSERAADDWQKSINVKALAVGTAIGAAISGAVAGSIELIKTTSEHITETDRWAKSLGISTQALLQWQYAATKAGISGDNIADIFKDLNDKIGDAVLNKSGEAAQSLDTLGLSAQKLQALSPDKQLLAIAQAMQGMNTAQKTNIYESLGNDLSKLMPLLDNGAQGLTELQQKASDLGIAPSDGDIEKLTQVNQVFQDWADSIDGFKNRFVVALAQIDMTPINTSLSNIQAVLTNPATLSGMQSLVQGALDLANFVTKVAAGLGNIYRYTSGRAAAISGNVDVEDIDQVTARLERLQNLGQGDSGEAKHLTFIKNLSKQAVIGKNAVAGFQEMLDGMGIPKGNDLSLAPGQSNQKQKTPKVKIDRSGERLDNSYASRLQQLQKQAALIDVVGNKQDKATELSKVNFDIENGNLSKLNDAQKTQLQNAAKLVDSLNAQKKAHDENNKAIAYAQQLAQQNATARQGNENQLLGRGLGSKARGRLQDMTGIQQDFNGQQADLTSKYNSGDISENLYQQETKSLQEALAQRLSDQQDYYNQQDEMQGDWQDGVYDSLQDYVDNSSDYYQQAADAMSDILGQATSTISDNLFDVLTGAESLGDAFKNIGQEILQSVVKALVQMAAQWLVMEALSLALGTTSTTASTSAATETAAAWAPAAAAASIGSFGGAAVAGIAAMGAGMVAATALFGMAHDGIDSVPQTGTWLLQKGERVTTASTSAKLDATLDRVSNQSGGNMPGSNIVINTPINGNPSDATIALVQQAAKEGARQGHAQVVQELNSGTGAVHTAVKTHYTKRRPE